jgi:hypothetical protein
VVGLADEGNAAIARAVELDPSLGAQPTPADPSVPTQEPAPADTPTPRPTFPPAPTPTTGPPLPEE